MAKNAEAAWQELFGAYYSMTLEAAELASLVSGVPNCRHDTVHIRTLCFLNQQRRAVRRANKRKITGLGP